MKIYFIREKKKSNLSYDIRYYKMIRKNNHLFSETLIQYM